MRVLIINTVREGFSTGKIAYSFCRELIRRGNDSLLAYGYENGHTVSTNTVRVSNGFEFFIHHCFNAVTGYHSTWAPLPLSRIKRVIADFRPDIVQLYNLHGYYMDIYGLFDHLSKEQIPIVYGMLDEYPYLGYCAYAYDCDGFKHGCVDCRGIRIRGYLGSWFFNRARDTFLMKQKAYSANNICFTGPKWVIERAKSSSLLKDAELYEVDEFVDNKNTFIPRDKTKIRGRLGIKEDEVMVLNVAPSGDPRKGVDDFIDFAKKTSNQKIRFVNVGNQHKKEDLPEGYCGVGYVTEQTELSEFYSAADILFCTSHADTMPNVCLEALSCGTPIMGYDLTGIPYVAPEPLGRYFDINDKDGIIGCINKLCRKTPDEEVACRECALQKYSLEVYTDKMMSIYKGLLNS